MPFDLICVRVWISFCVGVVLLRLWRGNGDNPSDPDWLVITALLLGALSVLIFAVLAFLLDRTVGTVVTAVLVTGYLGVVWSILRRTRREMHVSMPVVKRKRKRYPGGRLPY